MNCECGLEMKTGDELCPRCGKSHDGQWSASPTCSTAAIEAMKRAEEALKEAWGLTRNSDLSMRLESLTKQVGGTIILAELSRSR